MLRFARTGRAGALRLLCMSMVGPRALLVPGLSLGVRHITSSVPQLAEARQVTIDRELPDPFVKKRQNRMYFVAYGIGITVACIFIFNYEKTGSPVVHSVLYFLRRSEQAQKVLGEDISFAQQWPWIWGELNTNQGNVDITFDVSGTKGSGTIKLKANRELKMDPFHIHWWTLDYQEAGESKKLDLLKDSSIEFGL